MARTAQRTFSVLLLMAAGLVLICGLPALAAAQDDAPVAAAEIAVEMAFGVGVDPDTRVLEGEATEFSSALDRIYCWTRITNGEPPLTVTHAWFHEGKSKARVELNVGSADWRTYSSKRLLPAWKGQWEVKVLDAAGKVLASQSFTVN